MMDIQAPDPLSAFTIMVVCLAVLCVLFALATAVFDHVISPWRERRRLDRLLSEIEREIDRALNEELD